MEYRIRKENDLYRAEVNHKTLYGVDYWTAIENDTTSLCACRKMYKTVEDAREAIKEHHQKQYANTKDDESSVVEKFNL